MPASVSVLPGSTEQLREKSRQLQSLSEAVLTRCKNCDTEIYATHSKEFKIVYENDDFTVTTAGESDRYGIRVIDEQRTGFVTTNSPVKEHLLQSLEEARAIAKLSPASHYYAIAKKNTEHEQRPSFFELSDDAAFEISTDRAFEFAEKVISEAKKDKRVSLDRAEFTLSAGCVSVMNSEGISLAGAETSAGFYAMGMARDGSDVTSFDYDGADILHIAALEQEIEKSMGRFRQSVLSSLGARSCKSYKGPVILHPALVRQFIAGIIVSNAGGMVHADSITPWKEKLSQQVAHPSLHVFEDPLNKEFHTGYRPFDREGLHCNRHDIIAGGKFQFIAHNQYSARRLQTEPTGNASGGSRSVPSIGFSNVRLSFDENHISKKPLENLFQDLGSGLLLKRFSGNQDMQSGNFSGVAKNSHFIENGEIAYPLKEVMVSGNLFDVIQGILAVTDLEYDIMGGKKAPYVIVDGISVTSS